MTTTTMNSVFTFKSSSLDHHVKLNTVHFTDVSDYVIEENTVDECNSLSSSSSQLSGWGSAESRKSYACLTSLVDEDVSPRQIVSVPTEGKGWGYFVDTKDNF